MQMKKERPVFKVTRRRVRPPKPLRESLPKKVVTLLSMAKQGVKNIHEAIHEGFRVAQKHMEEGFNDVHGDLKWLSKEMETLTLSRKEAFEEDETESHPTAEDEEKIKILENKLAAAEEKLRLTETEILEQKRIEAGLQDRLARAQQKSIENDNMLKKMQSTVQQLLEKKQTIASTVDRKKDKRRN